MLQSVDRKYNSEKIKNAWIYKKQLYPNFDVLSAVACHKLKKIVFI